MKVALPEALKAKRYLESKADPLWRSLENFC